LCCGALGDKTSVFCSITRFLWLLLSLLSRINSVLIIRQKKIKHQLMLLRRSSQKDRYEVKHAQPEKEQWKLSWYLPGKTMNLQSESFMSFIHSQQCYKISAVPWVSFLIFQLPHNVPAEYENANNYIHDSATRSFAK